MLESTSHLTIIDSQLRAFDTAADLDDHPITWRIVRCFGSMPHSLVITDRLTLKLRIEDDVPWLGSGP
jgi:hypothetical protein